MKCATEQPSLCYLKPSGAPLLLEPSQFPRSCPYVVSSLVQHAPKTRFLKLGGSFQRTGAPILGVLIREIPFLGGPYSDDPWEDQESRTPNSGLQNSCSVDYGTLKGLLLFGSAQETGYQVPLTFWDTPNSTSWAPRLRLILPHLRHVAAGAAEAEAGASPVGPKYYPEDGSSFKVMRCTLSFRPLLSVQSQPSALPRPRRGSRK